MGLPRSHAHRHDLVWHRAAQLLGLLVLMMLPLTAIAGERTSAWQTQTIPPAPAPTAAPVVQVPPDGTAPSEGTECF